MSSVTMPRQFISVPGRYAAFLNDDGSHAVVNIQTCEHIATFPPDDSFASDFLVSALNAQEALINAGMNPNTLQSGDDVAELFARW